MIEVSDDRGEGEGEGEWKGEGGSNRRAELQANKSSHHSCDWGIIHTKRLFDQP